MTTTSNIAMPFQRIGALSNAHVGSAFERVAYDIFEAQGISLQANHKVLIGVGSKKKIHCFDLGCEHQKVIVECKSHTWTVGSKVPSAKLTVWNEAMYYFHLAPPGYRKIMFVLKHTCLNKKITLAEYYLRVYDHLIPENVEFWEFDETINTAMKIAQF